MPRRAVDVVPLVIQPMVDILRGETRNQNGTSPQEPEHERGKRGDP